MIVTSEKAKKMAIIELTVPSEERIEVSGEIKRNKYQEIADAERAKGWTIRQTLDIQDNRGKPAFRDLKKQQRQQVMLFGGEANTKNGNP